MRPVFFLALSIAALVQAAAPAGGRVYLLPMASGLDQYLAHHLSAQQALQVVTDPATAELVFTDRLGPAFEQRMEELYAPAKPGEPEGEKKISAAEKEKKSTSAKKESVDDPLAALSASPPPVRVSSFGRGKGNLFLVDVKSRQVVWSAFEPAKSSRPAELDKTAERLVSRLKKSLPAR